MPKKQKLSTERRKEIFYAALDASESFRNSCGLRVEDVYGGFEYWLHRSIDENWKVRIPEPIDHPLQSLVTITSSQS